MGEACDMREIFEKCIRDFLAKPERKKLLGRP
jgi:hypothetical protein